MSLIRSFIIEHSNWESILAEKPYSLRIKRDDDLSGLVLFKYREGKSDFRNPLVREARGLILDENDDYRIVRRGFDKFFANNETEDLRSVVGDSSSPEEDIADWSSSYAMEKIDGSSILFYFWNGSWRVGTKGMIDAYKAPIAGMEYTFGHMVEEVLDMSEVPDDLEEDMTHMFEITSPSVTINVKHEDTELTYIISRENETGEYEFVESALELPLKSGEVKKPARYNVSSLNSALRIVSEPSFNTLNNEGIVVYDSRGPRMKVKTPLYTDLKKVRRHLTRKSGYANYKGMIKLILQDPNVIEFIESKYRQPWATKYFPLLRELRDHIENYLDIANAEVKDFKRYLAKKDWRKDQVRRYIQNKMTDRKLAWNIYDGKKINIESYYRQEPSLTWLVNRIRPHLTEADPGPAPKINYSPQ